MSARERLLTSYPTTTPAYLAYCHATGHSPELAVPPKFKQWEHDIQMRFSAQIGVTLAQFRMMHIRTHQYVDFMWAAAEEQHNAKDN